MGENVDGKCEHCDTYIGPVGYHESAACKSVLKRERDQALNWLRQEQEAKERLFKSLQAWRQRYLAARAEGERMVKNLQDRVKKVLNRT